MRLKGDVNYNIIGEFDINPIVQELSTIDPAMWEINKSRQAAMNGRGPHIESKSLFVYDVTNAWDGYGYPLEKYFVSEKLNALTDELVHKFEKDYNGKVGKTLYINLPVGKKIKRHTDMLYYLSSVHRFHIPIITNDKVGFFIHNEIMNMKAGICYELNNMKMHGVDNDGNCDRIHLLMDIIPNRAFKK